MKIQEVLNSIFRSIEATATASVKAITANVYKIKGKVEVSNFPRTQNIKGTVVVGNQKKVEEELKRLRAELKTIQAELPKIKTENVCVDNFPDYPKFPTYPKQIEVSNFPKTTKIYSYKPVLNALARVEEQIKKLELNPTINLPEPRVEVKPADVHIPDSTKVSNLSEIVEALEKVKSAVKAIKFDPQISVGGGGGKYAYSNLAGSKQQALVDNQRRVVVAPDNPLLEYEMSDYDESDPSIFYSGHLKSDGSFYIKELNQSVGTVRFYKASSGYEADWAARDTLDYNYFHEVFNG